MRLWEWPTLKILCETRQPTFGQLKTWPPCNKAQPALQLRWSLQVLLQCRHKASSAPQGFLGRVCLGPESPSWLNHPPQPGTESKETGRGRTAKCLLRAWLRWCSPSVWCCCSCTAWLDQNRRETPITTAPDYPPGSHTSVLQYPCARSSSSRVDRPRSQLSFSFSLFFSGLKIKG